MPQQPASGGTDWWAEVGDAAPVNAQPAEPEYPSYDPDKSASLRATAIASLAANPEQRIPYYARERGLPESRFKTVGPKVAYQADDGQWYYEESPNFLPRSFTEAAQQVAGSVGGGIPTLAGTITGIASAPLMLAGPAGLGASMAATGGAAAGAEAVRQALADEYVSPAAPDRLKILSEGVQAGIGQGIGAGLNAWQQRYAVPELTRYAPGTATKIEKQAGDLEAKAKRFGIQLTPAESTNLSSLKAQQKMLGNIPQSADDMAAFYERRQAEQVAPAVGKFMDGISPQSSPAVAGAAVRDAAGDAIEAAYKERTAQVSPLYQKVVRIDNIVPRQQTTPAGTILGASGKPMVSAGTTAKQPIDDLLADKFFNRLVQGVKRNPMYGMEQADDTSLAVLDQVKKNLDDMIGVAKRDGKRNTVRLLEQRRVDMLKILDKQFPEYPVARAAFEAKSPAVEEVANSVLGILSKLKDTNTKRAAGVLFSDTSSSPQQIAIARKTLETRDPEAWQGIKRAWLQLNWSKAGQETVSGGSINQGAKWRQLLLGNETRRQHLQAALKPDEFKALQDLADVLEATGRVKPIGSDTAWNEEMKRLARDRSTPLWARSIGNTFSPQDWGRLVKEWASERALEKHSRDLVEIIQQPDARALLKELKVATPESARFRAGVGHLLTRFVTSSTGRTAPTQEGQQ